MTEPATRSQPLTGRTLGDFVVRDKIGEGGYGSVYLAQQPALGREAVIKVLHAHHRADEQVIQRFLREAKLASKLDHPYAAHTYAFGAEPDGLLWIAMERVRGTPLDVLLRNWGRVTLERLAPLLDMLCEVLATAHEQGIVHRDVKPANVMVLSRAGRMLPKLLDFGIAKAIDASPSTAAAPSSAALEAIDADRDATLRGEELAMTQPGGANSGSAGGGALTQAGAVVGSPPYMAPEQWSNGAIGPATDLYALGSLTFEALTGSHPFPGRTLLAVARAHLSKPVPSLGEGFPPALDSVLRKAMAKRVEDRYTSTLEFAAAFREAAGLVAEAATLPRLPDGPREAALLDAPQPIADAVAAIEGATNARHAVDAVDELVATASRLVGLIAVAARSQIGAGEGDAPVVHETLRIARRRTLGDREWIELARALVRAFRARPDAHPLPELVALFEQEVADPFAPLLDLADERRAARGAEVAARTQLERALPLVVRLLGALAFLSDYPLVVFKGGVASRWSGARRGKRAVVAMERPLPDAQVALVSRDGVPVLKLSPLVQAEEPTPGAPDELFLFDGQGRHGARLVARPAGFVRRDDAIWEWFRAALPLGDEARQAQAAEERAPYRGLSSFTTADADLFVGREREVAVVTNRLRVQPFVAVVGPSGAGKSSFVHAGVVPNLPEGWSVLSTRPGSNPLDALAAELVRAGAPIEAAALRTEPQLLRRALLGLGAPGVLLIVDQFEEAFTQCQDDGVSAAYFAALTAAAPHEQDPLRVLVTLRDDFLMRAEREPALREAFARGLQLIGTPTRDELERILVEPARRAGYELEDRALASEMVAAAAGQSGALPLLSFIAAQMWELRDRHFKQLSRKVYAALGGVAGALAQHAERTLDQLGAEEQRLVRDAFRHLVTAEGTRAALSRDELLRVMGGGELAGLVADKLVRARLLIASEGSDGADRIEIIHEALLASWPRLVRWRQEDAEGARLRDQLRAAARQWDERGRPEGLLWRGEALAELQLWRARHVAPLPGVNHAFAERSTRAAARGRARVRTALVVVFLALAGAAAGFYQLSRRARLGEHEAQARVAELYEDQGRQALLDEDPERALAYLAEAMRGGREGAPLRFLLGRALAAVGQLESGVLAHKGGINRATYSSDRNLLLTSGREGGAVWSASDLTRRTTITAPAALFAAAWVLGDRAVLTAATDGKLRLHDASSGAQLAAAECYPRETDPVRIAPIAHDEARALLIYDDRVELITLPGLTVERSWRGSGRVEADTSADGRLIVVGDAGGEVTVWSLDSGKRVAGLRLGAATEKLRFDPDGTRVIAGSNRGEVIALELSSGGRTTLSTARGSGVIAIAFAPRGHYVALGADDGTLEVVERDGRLRWMQHGHRAAIAGLVWSPDGARLLSASSDGSARLWQGDSGLALGYLAGHRGDARIASYDGERALTFSSDGNLRIWRVAPLMVRAELAEPAAVNRIVPLDDGERIAIGCLDGTLSEWSRRTHARLYERKLPLPEPVALAVSGDGTRVIGIDAAASSLRSYSLPELAPGWNAVAPEPLEWLQLSSDGKVVVTAHPSGAARTWDAGSGKLLHTYVGPHSQLFAIAASPDGRTIASGGADARILLWDFASETRRATVEGHSGAIDALAYSPDGRHLVSASEDRTAKVWDAAGKPEVTLEGNRSALMTAGFTPDATLVATIAIDGTARVWARDSGRLLAEIRAVGGEGYTLAFTRNGHGLWTGGADRVAREWDVAPGEIGQAALDRLVRCRIGLRLEGGRLIAQAPDPTQCGR